jgi:hypothetical protein
VNHAGWSIFEIWVNQTKSKYPTFVTHKDLRLDTADITVSVDTLPGSGQGPARCMVVWYGEDAGRSVLYRISLAYLRKIAHTSESTNSSEPAEKKTTTRNDERFRGVTYFLYHSLRGFEEFVTFNRFIRN